MVRESRVGRNCGGDDLAVVTERRVVFAADAGGKHIGCRYERDQIVDLPDGAGWA